MPPRDHTARAPKYNEVGERGRMTGVEPPKNAPRDSAGNELPEAYFNTTTASTSGSQSQSQSQAKAKARASVASPFKPNGAGGRERSARPDMYNNLGERGRKTGVKAPAVRKGVDGFENPDDFFMSPPVKSAHPTPATAKAKRPFPPSASSPASSKRASPPKKATSSAKVISSPSGGRKNGHLDEDSDDGGGGDDPFAFGFGGGGTDQEDYEGEPNGRSASEDDMELDHHTSSTSRRTNSHHSPVSASSRRASVSSKAAGKRRHISQSPEQSDEDEARYSEQGNGDDDAVSEEGEQPTNNSARASHPKGKGKRRSSGARPVVIDDEEDDEHGEQPDQDDGNLDNFGPGLSEVEEEDEEEEQASDENARSSLKNNQGKGRASQNASPAKKPPPKKAPPKKAAQKITAASSRKRGRDDSPDEDGVRRSHRQRLQPVEYWRNERVVYKRRHSGLGIDQIVRVPKGPVESLANRQKGRGRGARGGSARVKSEIPEEEGVDDFTEPDGVVLRHPGDSEVTRRIVFTRKMINPKPLYNQTFGFDKIFSELDYLAGGILIIPSGKSKPIKPSGDNSYLFYCIEGSVSVMIHRAVFALGPGGTFLVPRGNNYSITATSNRDVKLFFAQARRPTDPEPEDISDDDGDDDEESEEEESGSREENEGEQDENEEE